MKTALILHGIGGTSEGNWFPWLAEELKKRGWNVILPDLPNTKHPDRSEWLETVQKLVKDVDFSDFVIIGHSLGVATALDLLEKEDKKLKMLISVSGFYTDYGAQLNSYFMKTKDIDINKVRNLVEKSVVIYGDDDPYVPQETLKGMAEALGVEPQIIKKGGHVNAKSGYTQLPLLFVFIK
jgi:uncharacterized protein